MKRLLLILIALFGMQEVICMDRGKRAASEGAAPSYAMRCASCKKDIPDDSMKVGYKALCRDCFVEDTREACFGGRGHDTTLRMLDLIEKNRRMRAEREAAAKAKSCELPRRKLDDSK